MLLGVLRSSPSEITRTDKNVYLITGCQAANLAVCAVALYFRSEAAQAAPERGQGRVSDKGSMCQHVQGIGGCFPPGNNGNVMVDFPLDSQVFSLVSYDVA